MTPEEMIDKIAKSGTFGFQIAKEFHEWNYLNFVDKRYKAPSVIYLANLIDNKFKESK